MRYVLLLTAPEERWDGSAIPGANVLGPVGSATTVRRAAGRVVIDDGPFAATDEVIGAYALLEVADLDAALAAVRSSPYLDRASVEIRPVLEPADG